MQITRVIDRLRRAGIDVDVTDRRLAEYSYDASNYRVRPSAVAFPASIEQCRELVRIAADEGLPLVARGGGTSMAGNAIGAGLVVDLSRHLNAIGDIDLGAGALRVEAGAVLGEVRRTVEAATDGLLTFAPDPSSLTRATIGGSIGNDACGNHSVEYGRMSHHVLEVEIVTASGAWLIAGPDGLRAGDPDDAESAAEAQRLDGDLRDLARANLAELRTELERIPRQVSGYHLGQLLPEHGFNIARALAGSEGTCALIVGARVGLVPKPGAAALVCLGYDSTVDSAREVMTILGHRPAAVEGLNASIVEIMRARRGPESVNALPPGEAYVMVEFTDADLDTAVARCEQLVSELEAGGLLRGHVIAANAADRAALWRVREDGAGLSSKRLDGRQTWPGWEDSAVAPEHLAEYLEELLPLIDEFGYTASMYGHFGAGCVHMRLDFDLATAPGRDAMAEFMRRAAEICVRHGGSLSGEHGDGRARGSLLSAMSSAEMIRIFGAFKRIWDPQQLLNPGIIVDPVPFTESLALQGAAPGNLLGNAHACIGVGRCRGSGAFMCPSYRATRDEKDSTRARARVLQETARGGVPLAFGRAAPEVLDSLDLCLSCKACSVDCPTGVDMAEAKSEVLDAHYRGRLRPLAHYAIGWLPMWIPLLTRMSALVNRTAKVGPLRALGDRLGISAKRRLPVFRPRAELARRMREAKFSERADVVLFADTFTRAFRPEVIPAAARVLGQTGAEVGCAAEVCCGITYISTGQRDAAARRLERLVERLDDGTERPIIVIEPSCAATIRDEGPKLAPGPAAERVASRVQSFAMAIDGAMKAGWRPSAAAPANAVVQPHCHEHAVFGSAVQRRVLDTWGVGEVSVSSSCCGVAGNFGYEAEHFDLSMQVAGHSLEPALRAGGEEALVLTDGFSCAMQVTQLDQARQGVHLATALDGRDV